MVGGAEGPAQHQPGVGLVFLGHLPFLLLCGLSTTSALPWCPLLGSDESPRPHPEAEPACAAAWVCCVLSRQVWQDEVNGVQVHFSNICKLLSVTAKDKVLGRKHQVFCCFSLAFASHIHLFTQSFRWKKPVQRKPSFFP